MSNLKQPETAPEVRRVVMPRTDVADTPEAVIVYADLPGVDAASLDVTIEDHVLTLHGKRTVVLDNEHRLLYSEYSPGDFHRTFRVSDEIRQDGIEATIKEGVLTLRLPKVPQSQARRIEIKSA